MNIMSKYTYNHAGERAIKRYGAFESMAVNGAPAGSKLDANAKYSAYVSPYYVENGSGTKSGAFSKHYYAGSERIVSKTADDAYFYFTDHLGSTTHITDRSGDVAQYAAYTPYGSLFREYRSVQPYKFNGKELDQETGYYYYGARYYDPITALWLGTDPLKHKYPDIGAYVYCAGNPVKYVDLDGREIIGVTKKDAQNLKTDIRLTLADKKFDGVRALINVKGSTFKSIDAKALSTALDGVTLSVDERAYVDMVTNTINSTDVHKIEYMTGANTSSDGAIAFKDHMNGVQIGAGDAMVPNGTLSSALITGLGGAGFNVPTKNGSHSFISSGVTGNERVSTSGHEVFGHGIPSAKGASPSDNNANAIRTDNLIRRMLGMPQRDGKDHGGYKEGYITDPQKLPITQ